MTLRPSRFVLVCGLLPTIAVALLSLSRPSFFASLEYGAYDRFLRALPSRPPSGRVVIVDIDERSLSAVGQWPWRRDVVGQLVERVRDLGASTVALDIVFAESDRFDASGAATDEAMARALRAGRVVLGYALTFDGPPDQASACTQHPLGVALIQRDDRVDDPFFRATGAVCSLPILTQAAGASGFLNAAPDPDGRLRRVPLLMMLDGRVLPSLALAAVVASAQTRDAVLRVINVNAATLLLDNRSVPLDGKSNMLLRYRGPKRTFSYVSAADVLSGQAKPDLFKDKIVIVGTTALGTREVVTTPIDTLFAGVEVQATVADDLLQRDFVHVPENGVLLETVVVVALGIVLTLLVGRVGLAWGGLGVILVILTSWASAFRLMFADGAFLSPVYPTIGVTSAYAAMAVAQLLLERRRADRETHDRVISQRLMVQGLLSLTEVRDVETGRHSRRTQQYARVIAEQLAKHEGFSGYLTRDRISLLASLAPLHDIGKVGVPDALLNKPGALTADEMAEMRKHPDHGRNVLLHAEQDVGVPDDVILAMAKDIVYTHHEKWDGTGYPQGLRGVEIPIVGRLIALVDVYDAITTRRTYREPMSHEEAVAFIVAGRGTHFDPSVVDAFVETAAVVGRLMAETESTAVR